jgi:hypothetical protein
VKTITTKTKKSNIMQRPITSRLRDNKNISKDPARQPVLHVGEVSPLKQTTAEAAGVRLRTTETTPGTTNITTRTTSGTSLPAARGGSSRATDTEAYIEGLKRRFPNATGQELKEKRYISSAYVDRFPESFTEEIVEEVPGKTVTTDQPVMTREKSTALSPYEQYQANLMYKRAVRGEKGSERKQQRDIAKEYGRRTGGNLYQKFKARRDVMTGKATYGDFQQKFGDAADEMFGAASQNYETYRGLTSEQQGRSMSAEQAVQQQGQGRARGSSVRGRERVATATDVGDPYVTAQEEKFGGKLTPIESGDQTPPVYTANRRISGGYSPAKMMGRHMNSVGMKQTSALKKGYFKGK